MKRTAWGTAAAICVVVVAFAAIAWSRRWIADDGLIVVRGVRQILAGHGPVFNQFERAESNTSTLWPWLLAGLGWLTRVNITHLAVATGWLCSVLGIIIAMDGTTRLHRAWGATGMSVPAGMLVVIGISPFWDYATSGLETGLCTLWIGVAWWSLVALQARPFALAFVLGLGPLVRPDFAIASAVLLGAAWVLVRPSWKRTLALAAVAIALPLAYEVFRAGYYGTLVPLPALAKSASGAQWLRGVQYLVDFATAYRLWIPMVAIGALVVFQLAGTTRRIVIVAPVVAGFLHALFVVRVGGDFMHGRMLLAPTLLVALPVAVIPVGRRTAGAIAILAGWAVFEAWTLRGNHRHIAGGPVIEDERYGYIALTRTAHPVDDEVFVRAIGVATKVADALREHQRLLITEAGLTVPIEPVHAGPLVFLAGRLGTGGVAVPLDAIVVDTLGLANPLGARITARFPGHIGHEKPLPMAWVYADHASPTFDSGTVGVPRLAVRAARHAMQCGELAELLHSVRDPLTPSRFWSNLTGALRRTRLVIPSDPIDAEWKFCGAAATTRRAEASSAYEQAGWAIDNAIDDDVHTSPESRGFSSGLGNHDDHAEWLAVTLPVARAVSCVVLHPRDDGPPGIGFPAAFAIQTWNGHDWVDRAARTDVAPPTGPVRVCWDHAERTDRVRLYATHLRQVGGDGYVLQLAELETP
jgi:arabinofuranosyltransferase